MKFYYIYINSAFAELKKKYIHIFRTEFFLSQ